MVKASASLEHTINHLYLDPYNTKSQYTINDELVPSPDYIWNIPMAAWRYQLSFWSMFPGLRGVWHWPEGRASGAIFPDIRAVVQRQHHSLNTGATVTGISSAAAYNLPNSLHQEGIMGEEVGASQWPRLSAATSQRAGREDGIVWVCASLMHCVQAVHIWAGGGGGAIMLGSHKSTGCNSQAIYY